jgi:hypothetical protein
MTTAAPATVATAAATTDRPEPPTNQNRKDTTMTLKTMKPLATAAAIMMATAVVAAPAQARGTTITAALHGSAGFPSATGSAKFKKDGANREFEAQVEHVRSLAGKRLTVFVHGTRVGRMTVGNLGRAHLNRSTELGQSVPQVSAGNRVNVRTAAGTLVATGKF